MRVVSHPEADEELEAAALWYEERQPGMRNTTIPETEHSQMKTKQISGPFLRFFAVITFITAVPLMWFSIKHGHKIPVSTQGLTQESIEVHLRVLRGLVTKVFLGLSLWMIMASVVTWLVARQITPTRPDDE